VYVLKFSLARLDKIEKKGLSCTERAWDREKFSEARPTVIVRVTPYMEKWETLFPRVVGATEILALRYLSTL